MPTLYNVCFDKMFFVLLKVRIIDGGGDVIETVAEGLSEDGQVVNPFNGFAPEGVVQVSKPEISTSISSDSGTSDELVLQVISWSSNY